MENYTVENIIKNKQCVYCGAEEKVERYSLLINLRDEKRKNSF